MAGPRNQELGIRNPKSLRGGINFPLWEGVNRQNDPGAIRDTQIFTGINIRLNGNEIQERGGMVKVSTTQMTGCVYGFIDVPEGATSLILVAASDVGADLMARLDRYYSEASPPYNTAIEREITLQPLPGTPVQYATDTLPRRSLARYDGGLYEFGQMGTGNFVLFRIIFPERTTTTTGTTNFLNQTKLVGEVNVPEFASFVERKERFSDTILTPILYIGSVSTGKVYRWDGVALSAETSNLTSKRHIVATYFEDVYAICGDNMRKRGIGNWATNIALGTAGFVPNAATEYMNKFLIVGQGTALTYDGTTVTNVTAAVQAVATDTLITIADVRAFNSFGYLLCRVGAISPVINIIKYDGTTFSLVDSQTGDGPYMPGCFEPSGDRLWFTFKSGSAAPQLGWVDLSNTVTWTGPGPSGPGSTIEHVQADMLAF